MGCGCPAHPFPPLKLLQDSCHTSVLQGSAAVRHCPAAGLRIILPFKSAAGQLSCSCPVEPFFLVDVLKDSCPRCVLQVSFKQENPATVGHAATRTRRRAAGQWVIHTMRSDGKQTEKENRDGSHDQTQATEHARPIRRTSPTSGVTSRCHGTNSHNSKNENTHKNNCVCVAFLVSVGGFHLRTFLLRICMMICRPTHFADLRAAKLHHVFLRVR